MDKMEACFPKVRHRIHRTFLAWYAEHQAEFMRSLSYVSRKNDSLFLGIEGLHPVFEPFLNWLNNTLIPAKWLGLYGEIGCEASTWVELLIEPDSKATRVLPLWLPSNITAKDTTMIITMD
jgi:hypothetical protein